MSGGMYPAAVLEVFGHIMSGGMYPAAVLNVFGHIMSGGMYPAAVLKQSVRSKAAGACGQW